MPIIPSQVLFVTGIDTNIGKTYATAFLFDKFSESGQRVITQKLVQTGCVGTSEDIEAHRRLTGCSMMEGDRLGLTCPYIFSYPASPHFAADIDGKRVDCKIIDRATEALLSRGYDRVLLEGAGGLMVPITKDYLTADFIADRDYPIALVTSGRLGSINHTLLNLELCRHRDITVETIVYNLYPAEDDRITANTLDYLRFYLDKYHPDTQLMVMSERH
ncbi:ATP-dependent dethiobiotin synthetase BioD [Porphyromonas gulae]|uniref:ATP-dependent dethiobiotin synthetase BioD n=1 Tax=Porphyromonas gulae TaxID=111105 RepID=A0A0A2GP11_9PORP|nr:dethiobiotin synthase [Porphyromonas gulae]KGN77203.1 ATP-dependent dethiobiotin synthetase BioD [Porphyromonas gulae]KGN83790.1 ATP-dependent dethiobiotin synthetase BioD [Porphyromonas gulae]KGO04937.1 ATP-dependent dethiobiotin synthetase BioD [Porphyromonas gulae]